MWKKTPGANNNRPHRRRRIGSLRRIRVTRNSSNTPPNKKEETPEPTATEDNSSLTEDDASECDSDSSITNKRSNTANSELTGDESPSRMRTRNKPAKESNNKRPKRGTETPDATATNENAKTPNKTDRRKSSKETPTKGKKRTNIDLDVDNDGSDEKEKRKRTEVMFHLIDFNWVLCRSNVDLAHIRANSIYNSNSN